MKLVEEDTVVRHIFVRASDSASAYGIPPGPYRLLVSQGKIWDPDQQRFQCNACAFEFVNGAEFSESAASYSVISVTLQPTPLGTPPPKPISLDAFNAAG